MTEMDILEFRDINQPPPVGKIIGDEENAPGGKILPPPGPNRVKRLNPILTILDLLKCKEKSELLLYYSNLSYLVGLE